MSSQDHSRSFMGSWYSQGLRRKEKQSRPRVLQTWTSKWCPLPPDLLRVQSVKNRHLFLWWPEPVASGG